MCCKNRHKTLFLLIYNRSAKPVARGPDPICAAPQGSQNLVAEEQWHLTLPPLSHLQISKPHGLNYMTYVQDSDSVCGELRLGL